MHNAAAKSVEIREPNARDGAAVWQLINDAGTLDVNSTYCYIMLCDIFRDTCAVARMEERTVGFISAYIRPDKDDTLFVWQVAVHPSVRGKGLAKAMLRQILERNHLHVNYVEATIGPDNTASRRLFAGLAAERDTEIAMAEQYGEQLFPVDFGHEPEQLYRIGPLRKPSKPVR